MMANPNSFGPEHVDTCYSIALAYDTAPRHFSLYATDGGKESACENPGKHRRTAKDQHLITSPDQNLRHPAISGSLAQPHPEPWNKSSDHWLIGGISLI